MYQSKIFYLITVFCIPLFVACGMEDKKSPIGPRIEEEMLDGSISGILLDSAGEGIEGIAITTSPGGYSTTSDFAGYFEIPKVEEGTYSILIEGGVSYADTIIKNVKLLEDQVLSGIEVKLVYNNEIQDQIDENKDQVDENKDQIDENKVQIDENTIKGISGELNLGTDEFANISRIEIQVLNLQGDTLESLEAELFPKDQSFSATLSLSESMKQIELKVFDQQGNFVGILTEEIEPTRSNHLIASFEPYNTKPTVKTSMDTNRISIHDTLTFGLDASDTLGGRIIKKEISINGEEYFELLESSYTKTFPDSGIYSWRARVWDDDSNFVLSEMMNFEVLQDPPTVKIIGDKYPLLGEWVTYSFEIEQEFGEIISFEWIHPFRSVSTQGTVTDSTFQARWPRIHSTDLIRLKVIDDDSNEVIHRVDIQVNGDSSSKVTDGPHHSYTVSYIGNQIWMKENYDRDRLGYSCYDNDFSNCTTYGYLYSWGDDFCPTGWRLPKESDWQELFDFYEMKAGIDSIGIYMKDLSPGSSSIYFTSLMGGELIDNNSLGIGQYTSWWGASDQDPSVPILVKQKSSNTPPTITTMQENGSIDQGKAYVRCMKDI